MNKILTKRQYQIAGLIACGMAKKEIADSLNISIHTVDNITKEIYVRVGVGKINELTGWWISRKFNLSIDFNELKKQIIASCFLVLVLFQIGFDNSGVFVRRFRENEIELRCEKETI